MGGFESIRARNLSPVQRWSLREIATPEGTRSPVVLETLDAARAVLVGIEPGQELGDHQVKERAWLTVVQGAVMVECGGESFRAEPGDLVTFDPDERHAVRNDEPGESRILLLLAPWPGDGHYRGGGSELR